MQGDVANSSSDALADVQIKNEKYLPSGLSKNKLIWTITMLEMWDLTSYESKSNTQIICTTTFMTCSWLQQNKSLFIFLLITSDMSYLNNV